MADFRQPQRDLRGVKDSVILEKNEVTKDDGKPTRCSPYSRKWRKILSAMDYAEAPSLEQAQSAAWLAVPEAEVHRWPKWDLSVPGIG